MFEHILVPLDGSALAECVLPHVVTLARAFSARVTLLRVLRHEDLSRQVDPVTWHIAKTESQAYLINLAARMQALGVAADAEVLEGQPAERVIEFAQTHQVGLIALSSHGQSGLSGWNVSSVVQKIIMRANLSVLIVRAYQPAVADWAALVYSRVFVPLDCSARAEHVLPLAITLARVHTSRIVLVHVVHRPEVPCRDLPRSEDLALAEQLVERNRAEAQIYLKQLSERYGVDFEIHLLVSDSVMMTLQDQAEQEQASLVILSAHGQSGQFRWPYGSLVVSFIAYGTAPLLIVQDIPSNEAPLSPAEVAVRRSKGH